MQYSIIKLLYCGVCALSNTLGFSNTVLTAKLRDGGAWKLNRLTLLIQTLFCEIIEVNVFPYYL